jgi:CRISPR/Cas system CMR subunit Cmr4 (Cas7 group RAMP superfamily)
MQLNDMEQAKIRNTIRKFSKALIFAFPDKTDIYIGYFALMTAQMFINRYFDEDVATETEFKNIKRCLLADISEFTKNLYSKTYKGDK